MKASATRFPFFVRSSGSEFPSFLKLKIESLFECLSWLDLELYKLEFNRSEIFLKRRGIDEEIIFYYFGN
jgi:hypothetical protein